MKKNDLSGVVVVLDVDNTLYPYHKAIAHAIRHFPQHKNFNLPYKPPTTYDLTGDWRDMGMTQKLWDRAHKMLVTDTKLHDLIPIAGTQKAVQKLLEMGATIEVQTMRLNHTALINNFTEEQEKETKNVLGEWLDGYFNLRPNEIQYTDTGADSKPKSRGLVKSEYKRVVFVDDSANEIKSLTERDERCVMYCLPSNEWLLNEIDNLLSFADWCKAPDKIVKAAWRKICISDNCRCCR